ncbi:MAG: amino acid ABC transporter ATP-binding protein [Betaproteobacteria bacterium HGW-Betaproteobacteria-13]|nr:MAG: amino acid ABC transporter ATP-binding protein [Betaproteobacteria bacterium HGW-Betaproteobacteria-13]
MSLVKITGLHKHFGSNHVLKGIDLEVAQGDVIALIGRSGSGKSTLLRTINGLETIDKGELMVDGTALHDGKGDLRALRQKVGMVFQQFNLFPHLTAGQNVMLAPTVVKGMAKKEVEDIAREMMLKVGLSDKFDSYPDQLSGGQQQRVAIARALAMQPKVLLCDEIATEGMTLIMVTHEMRFARDVGNKLIFMHHGRIHESGDPKAIFAAPQTPELANFVGSVLSV